MPSGSHSRDRSRRRVLASEAGFSIVEIIVASFVLVVGMLGVLALMTSTLARTSANAGRVGATNLVRELIEATRALDYDDMTGTLVRTRLQARGYGSGTPWTIERRSVVYTVSVASCTYDNPSDGLASPPPEGVCTPQPSGAGGDANGEDFRRTTFAISWADATTAQPRSLTQSTLVVNPAGGLGPRVTSITPVAQTITASVTTASVTWATSPATVLRWVVDDGASAGSVTGSTSFTTSWDIGTSGSGSEILDGSYQITAQPYDDRDVAGEAKRANVVLNRRRPYAPPTLAGGHDTRLNDWVDLEWTLNRERDVLGYRAYWAGADAVVGSSDDAQVCPAPAEGIDVLTPSTTACVDLSPPTGATKYYVAAVDRDSANALRDGDRRSLSVSAASSRPATPIGLTVLTLGGQPTLVWIPALFSHASFYRVYRDGTRYDKAAGSALSYTDTNAGGVSHQYWVTAVDSTYNESNIVGPILWSSS